MDIIEVDWPAPANVRALSTTRIGGASEGPFASLNLSTNVGDSPAVVAHNRGRLRSRIGLPSEPVWLMQVHGCDVAHVGQDSLGCEADAAVSASPGRVCAVMTADCLPVLLCDAQGSRVAAVHAGWRGLAAGVIEAAVQQMEVSPAHLMAWLGPAIGPDAFEVGDEVRVCFLQADSSAEDAFRMSPNGHWLADLYKLARLRLNKIGIESVYGGGYCTFSEPQRFFSYRRDGVTGRMASVIWLDGVGARTSRGQV